ncbi:hypothetical protein N7493_010513 [Penicillium malachiteum]|uniref:Uncharacterized protein n=1 Tax=Penicillium malachiteum TaxID=1324776 RepID=A0AAD6MRN2_9EURO|nr:hypothetical protein N7493_010513 [Penicillium malachiteum]
MSDDEDYYEFEEEYLFEDPVPDLVDELAASSYYEAALYDDPAIDVEDYYSDWDYYSDDYYDDDPTVKQSSQRTKSDAKTKNKNRRAHPASVAHHPPLNIDVGSFQGVVWKTSTMERDQDVSVQIYEPGQLEKVAFLEDWREIFKSAQPTLDKSRLRKKRAREPSQSSLSGRSVAEAKAEVESLGDDEREESSDEMSDILSWDQTNESVDAGEGSNTTPEPGQSPKERPSIAVEIPVKRGRKRKAEVPVKESQKKTGTNPRRSKRVALDKNAEDTSAPVRRSTRQKK